MHNLYLLGVSDGQNTNGSLRACLRVYVPVQWNFTLYDVTHPECCWPHKNRKMESSATFSSSYMCVPWHCHEPRLQPLYIWVSYLWSCCSTDFLTGLLTEMVGASVQSVTPTWSSDVWDESWWDISCYNVTPNSPCIIFSVHSHSVQLMPSYLGRDFPSVYVETKFSAMWKCRGKNT